MTQAKEQSLPTVAVLGLGQMGTALACRLGRSGVPLRLGSRNAAQTNEQVRRVQAECADGMVPAGTYAEAAAGAEVVILAAGFEDLSGIIRDLGSALSQKIVVDISTAWEGPALETSAFELVSADLPAGTALVGAWKTNYADSLNVPQTDSMMADVFLCGDDAVAKEKVAVLVAATNHRPVDCGEASAARMLEAMVRVMGPIHRRLELPPGTVPAWKFLPEQTTH